MTGLKKALKSLKHSKQYYALEAVASQEKLRRLPVSIRVMLESLIRNCDGIRVKEEDVERLANWAPKAGQKGEVPFVVARVLLQDFTGVPLIVDLAAMRDAAAKQGKKPAVIEPLVPVDLVIDHSVQVDKAGTQDSYLTNLKLEFDRNLERYTFLKWGEEAFKTFRVVPPGIGICHQVNLEYFGSIVIDNKDLLYFDTLVGTDSHTTMINGLGIVAWGVGGIEAGAAMLGQPVTLPMPEVIGFYMKGELKEGVTATDLTLRVTQMLREKGVVDKFVEFYGEGVENLSVADRATIANMAPEYGATMGFFPVDDRTLEYLELTGRKKEMIATVKEYLTAQHMFGIPKQGEIHYTSELSLDLGTVEPSIAGPKRPQDRISLKELKPKFLHLLETAQPTGYGKTKDQLRTQIFSHTNGGFSPYNHQDSGGTEKETPSSGWSETEMFANRPFTDSHQNPGYAHAHPGSGFLTHGSVVIAAITSCTNTSNPSVMIAAGLLAKKAVEKGLKVNPFVKTSLAPGSRVVTEYLKKAGLEKYLDELGFQLVGYGCTTCIGNSGPLDARIEEAIQTNDLISASVLSGNRNFEARIHSAVKANFLMSPPLVVAFALAGKVNIDLEKEPLGVGKNGSPVFLRDIWPTSEEVETLIRKSINPEMFTSRYAKIMQDNPLWGEIKAGKGAVCDWDPDSTYIQHPPYFEHFSLHTAQKKEIGTMRCLAIFGDSVTTDHISPAGAFSESSPAGQYLLSLGIQRDDFNSYGSRRGNHQIMMRGTFANVRIKNKMMDGKEGGFTKLMPEGSTMTIYDAAMEYAKRKTPLIIFAGKDYGMGSSRDWAAKGTMLLGVKIVIAESFERIHRSNLVGMGVLPLQFMPGDSAESLKIRGDETFSLHGLEGRPTPRQEAELHIHRGSQVQKVKVLVRIDTPIEVEYYLGGGIMPYVLRQILGAGH